MAGRHIVTSILFGLIWAAGMIWWSGDYQLANVAILCVIGVGVGFVWTWAMKKFGQMA